jgi:hypothetical protein
MGIGTSSKSCYTNSSESAPNPNPGFFRIFRAENFVSSGGTLVLVAEIHYVGCSNFEGLKICVYKGITSKKLKSQVYLDPHFSNAKFSPVARFKPDKDGWNNACLFAKLIL